MHIKKLFFIHLFIFIQTCHHNNIFAEAMLVKATETAVKGVKQLTIDHLPTVGKIATEASSQLGSEASKELATGMKDASSCFGVESVAKLAPAINIVTAAYTVTQVWSMGKDIKSYCYPSDQDKARIIGAKAHACEMQEKYESLMAKKAFKECLKKNIHAKRSASGIPCACEEVARIFAMAAGCNEADQITTTFNKIYNKE